MSVEQNIQLVRRWFQEVWNEGHIETVHELLSPDAVARGQRGAEAEIRGPEEFVRFVHDIRGTSRISRSPSRTSSARTTRWSCAGPPS